MSGIKKCLFHLPDYRVDQSGFSVKLNQNENPGDWPETLKNRVLESLARRAWNRYPDGEEEGLRAALSDYVDRPSSWILPGGGSNEMILTLAMAVGRPGGRMATVTPGFSVYGRVAAVLGMESEDVPLKPGFDFDVPALEAAARGADLVFLASPNNPTGNEIDLPDIERIARACPGLVALDEAYFEFSGRSGVPLLDKVDNLVILRTFSKAWSSAGLRLGYMVGPPALVNPLRRARLPFSVGLLPQIAGTVLIENREIMQRRIREIVRERERMSDELSKRPDIRVFPSRANFLLFECLEREAVGIAGRLGERGVAVRRFEDPRLGSSLRVTIGTGKENDRFLSALKDVLREEGE